MAIYVYFPPSLFGVSSALDIWGKKGQEEKEFVIRNIIICCLRLICQWLTKCMYNCFYPM